MPTYLTVSECAAIARVSASTFARRLRSCPTIKSVKHGRAHLIDRQSFEAWMADPSF
jgi:hypothetical protein